MPLVPLTLLHANFIGISITPVFMMFNIAQITLLFADSGWYFSAGIDKVWLVQFNLLQTYHIFSETNNNWTKCDCYKKNITVWLSWNQINNHTDRSHVRVNMFRYDSWHIGIFFTDFPSPAKTIRQTILSGWPLTLALRMDAMLLTQ